MAGSLTERDLFSVLKALYRTLLKSIHPDVARKRNKAYQTNRAIELNLAFEALDLDKNPATFRQYRKQLMTRRPQVIYQRSLALQRELDLGSVREEQLAESYFQRLITDYGWPGETPVPTAVMSASLPLKDVTLGLLDVAINQNLKMASWSLGSNYKEINFDTKTQMTIRGVGRKKFVEANYIHLLGSVPAEEVDLLPILERPPSNFFKAPALAGADSAGPSVSVLNLISRAKFKSHILPHLKPFITERAYLFSLNRSEFKETGYISLEGLVVKINKHQEAGEDTTQPLRKKASK